jgi:hypothetical protein
MEREGPPCTCGELGISYIGSLTLSVRHERVLGRNRYLGRGVDGPADMVAAVRARETHCNGSA